MFLDHDSERSRRHRRKRGEKEERHEEASKREKSILKYVTLKRKAGGEEEDEKFSFERKEGINPSPLPLLRLEKKYTGELRVEELGGKMKQKSGEFLTKRFAKTF